MHNIRNINNDIIYVGCSDRKINIFEATYPINNGMAYNSYLINDDKTILIDTVEKSRAEQFYKNLEAGLNGKNLDYLIVQHMEPDHAALIEQITKLYPQVKILCSSKTVPMLKQFFDFDVENFVQTVKEGDSIKTQNHELVFVEAPMVHWPEVIVTYDKPTKTLFSADAFGSFGAINGNLFDTEINWNEYLPEARRYFTNIVGKFGAQVQMLLKKASGLEIETICPLHGVIVKENITNFIEKYDKWSKYEPEDNTVVIAYSSVYGGTENTVEILAAKLAQKGVKNIKVYDTSMTHPSYILSEAFRASHLVIATTTYNGGIFVTMDNFLNLIASHNLKNRKVAIIQNGTWVPACDKVIREKFEKLGGTEFVTNTLSVKSALKGNQADELEKLAQAIVNTL